MKMGISSSAFSSPHCLMGVPEARNTGKGHTPICSNINTTPGPILTSPNFLEMLFLCNSRWSGDLRNAPASFGLMFMATPLSAESDFMLYSIKGQTAAFLLHIQD